MTRHLAIFVVVVVGLVSCDPRTSPPRQRRGAEVSAVETPTPPKQPPQKSVRIVAHPHDPGVMYVTDFPPPRVEIVDIVARPRKAGEGKLYLVDVRTGQWHEMPLGAEIVKRFADGDSEILASFEVGSPPRPATMR